MRWTGASTVLLPVLDNAEAAEYHFESLMRVQIVQTGFWGTACTGSIRPPMRIGVCNQLHFPDCWGSATLNEYQGEARTLLSTVGLTYSCCLGGRGLGPKNTLNSECLREIRTIYLINLHQCSYGMQEDVLP